MAGVNSVKIAPAFGGQNSEASPEYVAPTQAVVLENLLPRPGKIVLRGPISEGIDLGYAAYNYLKGAISLGSNFVVVDDNNVLKAVASGVVTAGVGAVKPGLRSCALGPLGYSIPCAGDVPIVRFTGDITLALTTTTGGPASIADITVHLSRVFTITRSTNTLNWSDQGGPTSNAASDWQDDVSGLTNAIAVGDSNDLAVGLAHCNKQLAIVKDRSIFMLTGLTPTTFSVNRVTSEWGGLSVESIVDWEDGFFALSDRGFYYFDGNQVADVSEDVRTELLTAIRTSYLNGYRGAAVLDLPFARAASIGKGYIMLTVGREYASGATPPVVDFAGVYDTRLRTWTKFSSDAFVVGAPTTYLRTPTTSFYQGATLGYDGAGDLLYLDGIAAPESADPTLAGTDLVDGTSATIPAESHSRIVALSSPTKMSQLKRLLFDYTFVVVADGETSVDCCSVQLVDGQGNELLAATPIQATILASGYTDAQHRAALVRKRFQVSCYAECSEVQLRVTLPALDPDVTEVLAAELHDATVEFTPGRDRPTT